MGADRRALALSRDHLITLRRISPHHLTALVKSKVLHMVVEFNMGSVIEVTDGTAESAELWMRQSALSGFI